MAFKSNMLFDVLGNILMKKSKDLYYSHIKSENFKDASKYMLLKYLSMHENNDIRDLIIDNYYTLEQMNERILYNWLLNSIPHQKSAFIHYLK